MAAWSRGRELQTSQASGLKMLVDRQFHCNTWTTYHVHQ